MQFFSLLALCAAAAATATNTTTTSNASPSPSPTKPRPSSVTKPPSSRRPATAPPNSTFTTRQPTPTYHRPSITLNGTFWDAYACSASKCRAGFNQCAALFGGDGCSCYPGLLQCTQAQCGGGDFTTVLGECYGALTSHRGTRCLLSCAPSYYPFVKLSSSHSTNSSQKQPPLDVDWTVVATFTVQDLSASDFEAAAFDFVNTLVGVLNTTAPVTDDNITYALVNATSAAGVRYLEVDVSIACDSLAAMNDTDRSLEYLLFVNETVTPFGAKLVDAGVLFNAAQLDVESVKTFVTVEPVDPKDSVDDVGLALPLSANATTTAPTKGPVEPKSTQPTLFYGLPQGVFMAIAAGGAGFLALLVACCCFGCRKNRTPTTNDDDKAAVQEPRTPPSPKKKPSQTTL
ncbi:Aste57867_14560 [Aphanomyces stellatus]|uniref:Aste57867_14560 protein n=1 Tax=Aphanomyces stellatus TaxID=120398 RepID=A0A485L2N0_9STRA|nr:hypothetical protein As57867_014506 [Aphanomyces stellatus]VFT91380.1 Aste57867_14560 [Aphanomyces stellatus]